MICCFGRLLRDLVLFLCCLSLFLGSYGEACVMMVCSPRIGDLGVSVGMYGDVRSCIDFFFLA